MNGTEKDELRILANEFVVSMDALSDLDIELRKLGDRREHMGKVAQEKRSKLAKQVGANIQSKIVKVDNDRLVIIQWRDDNKVEVSIKDFI